MKKKNLHIIIFNVKHTILYALYVKTKHNRCSTLYNLINLTKTYYIKKIVTENYKEKIT